MKRIEIARALAAAREAAVAGQHASVDTGEIDALLELPGLGRRRARQLHDELGIATLEELAVALVDGRVRSLRGFGDDACDRLRTDLRQHFAVAHRVPRADAERAVAGLLAFIADTASVERVEIAGSVRRRCATVGDVDILAVSSRSAQVIRHVAACPDVARVESMDASRATLVLGSGLRVDVRVVPRRSHGAALQFLTGSPAHNDELRRLGLRRGFRVSEYGVFSVDSTRAGARRTGGQCEHDIYDALGLAWIPPELREGAGEITAADERRLPALVVVADLRGDMHISLRSGDAAAGDALLRAIAGRGLDWCVVVQRAGLGAAARNATARPGAGHMIRALIAGVDADGRLEATDEELRASGLVIAELRPPLRLERGRMTSRLLRVINDPRIDVLAWPPGRGARRRGTVDIDHRAVFEAAASHGVALELRAGSVLTRDEEEQLRDAAARGVRFALGSGARSLDDVAAIGLAVDSARRAWIEAGDVINALPLDEVHRWLRRRALHRSGASAGAARD